MEFALRGMSWEDFSSSVPTTDDDVQKKVEGKLNKLGVDKIKALSRDLTGNTAARKAAAVTAIAQHLLA